MSNSLTKGERPNKKNIESLDFTPLPLQRRRNLKKMY